MRSRVAPARGSSYPRTSSNAPAQCPAAAPGSSATTAPSSASREDPDRSFADPAGRLSSSPFWLIVYSGRLVGAGRRATTRSKYDAISSPDS